MGKTVLTFSDSHCPFQDKKAFKAIIKVAEEKRPDVIVANGDVYDLLAFSKYPRNPYLITPEQEITKARYLLEQLFYDLNKASPKSKIFITRGNHSMRLHKRVLEKLPELLGVFDFDSLWKFEKVETIMDPREPLIIDDVIYVHGWLSRPGATLDYLQQSCTIGHLHKAYIIYKKIRNKVIWEANSGHTSNPLGIGMSYMPSKITNSVTSFLYKDDIGPRIYLV